MTKLRIEGILEYDGELTHGVDDEEALEWFYEDILYGKWLTLNDNGDLGDEIGTFTVLAVTRGDNS